MKLFFSMFISLSVLFMETLCQTTCRCSGKWVMLGLPKSLLLPLFPEGVYFADHPYTSLSSEMHPVIFEFNYQHDCWTMYVIPSQNMYEFKIEIPYVSTKNVKSAILKPLVLTNRWLNTMGARFVYGLPAYSVDFSGDGTYSFDMRNENENITVKAQFNYNGSWMDYNQSQNFEYFVKANKQPWLTDELDFDTNREIQCAHNNYFWEKNSKIRYMFVNFEISWGKIFDGSFYADNLGNQILGGVEVDVDVLISPKLKCHS